MLGVFSLQASLVPCKVRYKGEIGDPIRKGFWHRGNIAKLLNQIVTVCKHQQGTMDSQYLFDMRLDLHQETALSTFSLVHHVGCAYLSSV